MELATYRKPGVFRFKSSKKISMTACDCARCGFVEFHARRRNIVTAVGAAFREAVG